MGAQEEMIMLKKKHREEVGAGDKKHREEVGAGDKKHREGVGAGDKKHREEVGAGPCLALRSVCKHNEVKHKGVLVQELRGVEDTKLGLQHQLAACQHSLHATKGCGHCGHHKQRPPKEAWVSHCRLNRCHDHCK